MSNANINKKKNKNDKKGRGDTYTSHTKNRPL